MINPSISVIICCYNSSKLICKTLDHIGKQVLKREDSFEVIIVDNASTDETAVTANKFWNDNYYDKALLTIINENKQGIAYARKSGVLASKSDILLFCDDDNWLDKNYISIALKYMKSNPKIGVLGGHNDGYLEIEEPVWWQSKETGYAVGKQSEDNGDITQRGYVWGAGMVFRKVILEHLYLNGFKSLLVGREGKLLGAGDDSELCKWAIIQGYYLWYSKELKLTHFITKERLTKKYLEKLYNGHVNACEKLALYDFIIGNLKNVNSKGIFQSLRNNIKFFVKFYLGYKIDANKLIFIQIELGHKLKIHQEVYQILKTYAKLKSF
ncbi:glycosyltransferase [uncultured Lutibacter sp.]|uniref:glycosyltransferase n=1 Tax=uncultured Lutibacter sp. TaxID=437739 RepID=UPI0026165259|nr:glycosyltransferase [uncultured Lutibacter sp.]